MDAYREYDRHPMWLDYLDSSDAQANGLGVAVESDEYEFRTGSMIDVDDVSPVTGHDVFVAVTVILAGVMNIRSDPLYSATGNDLPTVAILFGVHRSSSK